MKRSLVLGLVMLAPTVLAGQTAAITGTWNVGANIGGTDVQMQCVLTQKDADLAGNCSTDQGSLAVTGKVDGKQVTFQFNTDYQGQTLTVIYRGTLETAEKIVGGVDVQPMSVSGDFAATKAKPAAPPA